MVDHLTRLLEVTLGGSVCILLLLMLGPVLAKKFSPKWRYWAWLVVAGALLLLPGLRSVSEALLPASIYFPIPEAVEEWTAPEYDGMASDEAAALPYGYQGVMVGGFNGKSTTYEVWYTDDSQVERHIYDFVLIRLEGVDGSWSIRFRWEKIWAAGAAVSLLLLGVGELRLRRFLRRRKGPALAGDLEELEKLCRRMGCGGHPRLLRVRGLRSPCLVGLFRPAVLLPQELSEDGLFWTLTHELTHWKRKDLWYQMVLSLARCVHWFNPLVWLMVRTARRDMELCCDYDLLQGREEEARRAYGRAILDQMTGKDRGISGLTTGFSGSKKEVFLRFRSMMDLTPKKKGWGLLALAVVAVGLSGSLVACQTAEPASQEPEMGDSQSRILQYAWVKDVDLAGGTVTYIPLTWEQWEDREALWDDLGDLEEETLPLTEDVSVYHTYEGGRYPLNPTAQLYTLGMSQNGVPGQLFQIETGPDAGDVSGIWLDVPSQLDLTAADLDFTGYCGSVYAAGMGGAQLLHGQKAVRIDPCDALGEDSDHTQYTLPLGDEFTTTQEIRDFLTGISSANYPDRFRFTVVDGSVTAVEEVRGVHLEEDIIQVEPPDPDQSSEEPSPPEHMPEYDPDFYGDSGAEEMPEFQPEFYGESGAQPLTPDGSGAG